MSLTISSYGTILLTSYVDLRKGKSHWVSKLAVNEIQGRAKLLRSTVA